MNRTIEKITQKLVEQYHPEKVVLFGSHAAGKATNDSDVDLFIIKQTSDKPGERIVKAYQAISNRNVPVDVVVYTPSEVEEYNFPGTFVDMIFREGKVLYEKQKRKTK